MIWIYAFLVVFVALWAVTRFYLAGGDDLSRWDGGRHAPGSDAPPSEAHFEIVERVALLGGPARKLPQRERLAYSRQAMDSLSDGLDIGAEVTPVDVAGVPGEWVIAPGSDPDRRLLYLHGGAFSLGSPKSHRAITAKFSKIAGAAVLAVDYRLMPENRRLDCLTDCQTAYRWILENGPQGPGAPNALFVAGDSAGGNLTLTILAWARDTGLRQADAAVALAPATDATLSGESFRANIETDVVLGPPFRPILRIPRPILLWVAWLMNRVRPCDPRISPIHGDLANLPPTLVHASESEILFDDAVRYVNKARAAGSPVVLETWPHVIHVWHIFEHQLPEARDAFDNIAVFLEKNVPRGAAADAQAS